VQNLSLCIESGAGALSSIFHSAILNTLERSRKTIATGALRLQEFVKGHRTFEILRDMEQMQWAHPTQLEKLQQQRLESLLRSAAANVRYYAELFRELGFDVESPIRVADLQRIPFLTKEIVRQNLDRLKHAKARRIHKFSTGGSTGAPLVFYLGSTRVSSDVAARMRAERWFGVTPGDPEFAIWGSPVELSKQDHLRELRDRVLRTRLLSAFEMNPQTMTGYLDEIERRGCRRIFGYPSSIALLCEHARREKRDLRKLGVKAVFVTAEYLYDEWRSTISETFGCAVGNGYGGRDSGFVAHECPAGGMHITADRLIVEIVDEQGRPQPLGHPGEIVVTNLDTPEMPFIRYRTGDIGTLAARNCRCGRTLPLLEKIEGRKTDFIVAPDGRLMHGLSLIYVIREIPGIESFRITQKRVTSFEVEIVRNHQYDPSVEARIREAFSMRLRAPVAVQVRYLESIAPTSSGKTRHVVSEITPPRDGVWSSEHQEQPAASSGSGGDVRAS
jgi:phenylacetate-coenzyme A ligase PaaK-like adenylate-forming protein